MRRPKTNSVGAIQRCVNSVTIAIVACLLLVVAGNTLGDSTSLRPATDQPALNPFVDLDSGEYTWGGFEFMENASFLWDTLYIKEWQGIRDGLNSCAAEKLIPGDALLKNYVGDLNETGFDAFLNLQRGLFANAGELSLCLDIEFIDVNYGAVCRAYERSVEIATAISNPTLQLIAHDVRHRLRDLALKIEKLEFGEIPNGRTEPALLIWKYAKPKAQRQDSTATSDN